MMITRRDFISRSALLTSAAAVGLGCAKQPRPNILWIIAEDICPDLGCYGEQHVHTPNIDGFAAEGVRYNCAFTTSPVCSPSRSAFMTGMYQTTIGAHNHRSHRRDGYRLPDGVELVTHYFREAGYFTANVTTPAPGIEGTGKTDFNFSCDQPFDGTYWDQREPGTPFFAQINLSETHRTFKKAEQNPIDPGDVVLPPYYPDHPVTRHDWALYLDTVGILDRKVGAILDRLEQDDLLRNTVVFFFGDNGRPHVRGKQWLYDGGIHIPLIIRWPDERDRGTVSDDLVSAIDITATSLHLAGIPVPGPMQGRIFAGPGAVQRDFIVAARDRCDETVDLIRCVRTQKYKYILNYYPERPYTQLNRYKENEYPVLRLMRRLAARGELTPVQERFFADNRPAEELYDLQADPHETVNLAADQSHTAVLQRMRDRLDSWIESTGDLGRVSENREILDYYEALMKDRYDEQIKIKYREEGMSLDFFS